MSEAAFAERTIRDRLGPWPIVLLLTTASAIQDSTVLDHFWAYAAGHDLWIAILLGSAVAAVGVFGILALLARFPGIEWVDVLRRILGPVAGPVVLLYVGLFFVDGTLAGREFEFMSALVGVNGVIPPVIFMSGLFAVSLYGAFLGIEVVSRVNTFLLLFIDIPLGIVLMFLSADRMSLGRLLPVAFGDWHGIWISTLLEVGQLGSFVLLLLLAPRSRERGRTLSTASLVALALIAIMALGHTMGPALSFGQAQAQLFWPTYSELRTIDVARFVTNLDVVGVILLVHGFWLESTVSLWAGATLLGRLFRVRDVRRVLVPITVAAWALALWGITTDVQDLAWRYAIDTVWQPALGFGVPLVLLAGVRVRAAARSRRVSGPAPTT